jgi:hypothetical protein
MENNRAKSRKHDDQHQHHRPRRQHHHTNRRQSIRSVSDEVQAIALRKITTKNIANSFDLPDTDEVDVE